MNHISTFTQTTLDNKILSCLPEEINIYSRAHLIKRPEQVKQLAESHLHHSITLSFELRGDLIGKIFCKISRPNAMNDQEFRPMLLECMNILNGKILTNLENFDQLVLLSSPKEITLSEFNFQIDRSYKIHVQSSYAIKFDNYIHRLDWFLLANEQKSRSV